MTYSELESRASHQTAKAIKTLRIVNGKHIYSYELFIDGKRDCTITQSQFTKLKLNGVCVCTERII